MSRALFHIWDFDMVTPWLAYCHLPMPFTTSGALGYWYHLVKAVGHLDDWHTILLDPHRVLSCPAWPLLSARLTLRSLHELELKLLRYKTLWQTNSIVLFMLGISTVSFWYWWHPVSQSLKALSKSGLFHSTSLSPKAFKPNHPICVEQRILKSSFLHNFGLLSHVALGWKARRSLEKILKEWETCVNNKC